jgi:hypothetical protein
MTLVLGGYVIAAELSDEDNIRLLGGGYYTASYDNGTALHWHDEPEKFADKPLLEKVYGTQGNARYVVARAGTNFYFAFPLQVASREEAQRKQLGPFSRTELTKEMMRLTGDSTLHQIGVF